jgi:hypothetical protein
MRALVPIETFFAVLSRGSVRQQSEPLFECSSFNSRCTSDGYPIVKLNTSGVSFKETSTCQILTFFASRSGIRPYPRNMAKNVKIDASGEGVSWCTIGASLTYSSDRSYSDQVSSDHHQPSSIIHQPSSTISEKLMTLDQVSSDIDQPSSIIHQPSSIIHQPSSIIHQPSSIIQKKLSTISKKVGHPDQLFIGHRSTIIDHHQSSSIIHQQSSTISKKVEHLPKKLSTILKKLDTSINFSSDIDQPSSVIQKKLSTYQKS